MAQGLLRTAKVPLGQAAHAEAPPQYLPALQEVVQSRQEVEAGAGWYLLMGQEVQAAASSEYTQLPPDDVSHEAAPHREVGRA